MSNEIMNVDFNNIRNQAVAIVASGFCGFTKPEEVITLALVAQDEGRSIGAVARDYHLVKGRPTLKADAMLARFQAAGGRVQWTSLTDKKCAAKFTHDSCGTFELEWTIEMAKKAKLTDNPTWDKYPRAMLRARVISEGIRTALPACLSGVYTPEEARDMAFEEEQERLRRKPEQVHAEVVEEPAAPAPQLAPVVPAQTAKAAAHAPQPTPEEKKKASLAKFQAWAEDQKLRVGADHYNITLSRFGGVEKVLADVATKRQFIKDVESLPSIQQAEPEGNPAQEDIPF